MLTDVSGYAIFASACALIAAGLLRLNFRAGASLSKGRLSRARRGVGAESKAADDMPSIVRERTIFLRKSKTKGANYGLTRYLFELEGLLNSSGTGLTLWQFFIIVAALAITFSASIVFLSDLDFFVIFVFSGVFSLFLSVHFLFHRKRRELRKFQEIFPDALDLIVRSVRAGLPVSEAIKLISAEVAAPVSLAFREIASNLSIGISLDESLLTLQKKVPIAEVKFFAISLTIQQETGGNIAEILSNLAGMMRRRVQIGKKIRALSSEARASAYIIGSLPFFVGMVIYALNREYIEVLFFNPTGQLLLIMALTSVFLGAIVIAKLIRFEI